LIILLVHTLNKLLKPLQINTMDIIIQTKLTRSEWDSIEIPVSPQEKTILKMIQQGYDDVNIRDNDHNSLFTFLKVEHGAQMEDYLYNKFFAKTVDKMISMYGATYLKITVSSKASICKADTIRIERSTSAHLTSANIYEILLLEIVDKMLGYVKKNDARWSNEYFTLHKLVRNKIPLLNSNVMLITSKVLQQFEDQLDYSKIIEHSVANIEQNSLLLKHEDRTLYSHQKEIYTIVKDPTPKLVLYIAPTGTGKTMTPIGLATHKKIIFVCAARHVGLALARSAISMDKKVAFAFGCESADDIRLHYAAAKVYTKNKRTGGIHKVDNSVGDKVEIMICDIKSYLFAMYYMIAFTTRIKRDENGEPVLDDNEECVVEPDFERILTYWDEPTITMDYADHALHAIIKKNWTENMIPNIVLSSATLPKIHEITETVCDFKERFAGGVVHSIVSHDCRKTIPIVDNDGFVAAPHHMNASYEEVLKIAEHCENYLTILRYFDLGEAAKFITYVNESRLVPSRLLISRKFGTLDDVHMQSIKLYYLELLKNVNEGAWSGIYEHFKRTRARKVPYNIHIDAKGTSIPTAQLMDFKKQLEDGQATVSSKVVFPFNTNSVYVTTKDAHTLTDGPTIFLTQDIDKIATFCIQQANIPPKIMGDIMDKITQNNALNRRIAELEKIVEDLIGEGDGLISDSDPTEKKKGRDSDANGNSEGKSDKKPDKKNADKTNIRKIHEELKVLSSLVKRVSLNNTFIPNSPEHIEKWASNMGTKNAFTGDIEDEVVAKIMLLDGVDDKLKVLLMMGIGAFMPNNSVAYTEIMKTLADSQRLYLIATTSDYIYGTNYQFCHGYIGKDLNLTQDKILQAMGRIGRHNMQQSYSVRFRDNAQIVKLFNSVADKPEVMNMNRLFNSR
jgi:hypothetical protein